MNVELTRIQPSENGDVVTIPVCIDIYVILMIMSFKYLSGEGLATAKPKGVTRAGFR